MSVAISKGDSDVDPITLAVVRGALETTQRQMTLTMMRTGRSSVLSVSRDFSNGIFNWTPEMIVQGQDLPIHLGSLILATKRIAAHFADSLRSGDVYIHNDPTFDGSHILDWCQYKPVFFEGELVFWVVSKGHMADGGGPVPGSYNPQSTDIYGEGLRIPPCRLVEGGVLREDLFNLLLANVRTRENIAGDLRAQLGAIRVGERNILRLLEKYGKAKVKACVEALLDLSETNMRRRIASLADGVHHGRAMIEDVGHGFGDKPVDVEIEVKDQSVTVRLSAPPQIPYYTNSYRSNTSSAVLLGFIMFMKPDPPYNEGMYRPLKIDFGPAGSMINAVEPAPHVASTTCPAEAVTDAVRNTLTAGYPEHATAGWGHCSAMNVSGIDPRTREQYVHMMVSTLACGAGAVHGMDGWHCIGPQAGLGGATCGEQELLEYSYPILVRNYSITKDSGVAGRHRGGCGVTCEIEPVDHAMTVVVWGEGRKFPASSVGGARALHLERKVCQIEVVRHGGVIEQVRENTVLTLQPGERIRTSSAGGGAVGPAWERDVEMVIEDVRDEKVSADAARDEYGVVLDPSSYAVNALQTAELRARMRSRAG
jgi:N-methylhydantoinase B